MAIEIFNDNAYHYIKNIKDNSVNLIITDPPYIIPNSKQGDLSKRTFKNMKHWGDLDKNKGNIRDGFNLSILNEFERIQPFLNVYIFCNAKLLQEIMAFYYEKGITCLEVLIYHKQNPIPACNGHYLPDMEYIVYICENKSSLKIDFNSGSKLFSLNLSYPRYTNHPTEKPLSIIETLIRNSSKEGDLIYDPFSGGGTTAHACKSLDRNFIGTEIDVEYYNESLVRIQNKVEKVLI